MIVSTSQVIISMTEKGERRLDMSINDYSDQAIEDICQFNIIYWYYSTTNRGIRNGSKRHVRVNTRKR